MAGILLRAPLLARRRVRPRERRGGAAAAHRGVLLDAIDAEALDIVLSGRFDLSLGFRSESVPRRRGRLCRRPGTLRAKESSTYGAAL